VLRGEATPIYIYWPQSLARLHQYNPDAKLILALRHPSFRAFSNWKMEVTRNHEPMTFAEAISDVGRARVTQSANGVHRHYAYIERSMYADQIKHLLQLFPRRQIYFLRTDDLWSRPDKTLSAIKSFLGVDKAPGSRVGGQYIVPDDSTDLGKLPAATRPLLDDIFRNDIRRTQELTQLDLSDWLRPDYEEPMWKPTLLKRAFGRIQNLGRAALGRAH
jgi:hypothetical protein